MPQVTVYIRKGDYERWKATENKSELIHKALNEPEVPTIDWSSNEFVPDEPTIVYTND